MKTLGTHLLVDFYGCDPAVINDSYTLIALAVQAVRKSGATVVRTATHHFEPQGVSGIVLIAESHLSFHSWPEHGVLCLDYFSCGDSINPQIAIEYLLDILKPERVSFCSRNRGTNYDDH